MGRPSNNPDFDTRGKTALDNFVGQQLPPPPPLYPDLSPGSLLNPSFSGKTAKCARLIARTRASTRTRSGTCARACALAGTLALALLALALPMPAHAQAPASAPATSTPDEGVLGEFVITGSNAGQVPLPKIAVLPSLSPDLEDVIVRGVVRRDIELTGMFA